MHIFYVGLDLGQKQDFSAVTVLERPFWYGGKWLFVSDQSGTSSLLSLANDRYGGAALLGDVKADYPMRLLYLNRWAPGTAYPTIVSDMADLLTRLLQHPPVEVAFLVDCTEVGQPIVEMFAPRGLPQGDKSQPVALTITGGTEVVKRSRVDYSVPKRDVIFGAVRMVESKRVHWPATVPYRGLLEDNLNSFQMKYAKSGPELFEAERKEHDDLVLSFAICCWYLLQQRPPPRRGHSYSG